MSKVDDDGGGNEDFNWNTRESLGNNAATERKPLTVKP